MNHNGNLHSTEALAIATNEVISLGLVKGYEILPTAPIPHCPFCSAVVIPSLVHLKHIVLVLLVPECYSKRTGRKQKKKKRIQLAPIEEKDIENK